jgi:hypothetical protein
MFRAFAAVAAAATILTPPAFAQDGSPAQTPENAKAFMMAVINRGGVRMLVGSEAQADIDRMARESGTQLGEFTLNSSPARRDLCTLGVNWTRPMNAVESPGLTENRTIAFRDIESISRSGADVRFITTRPIRLTFRSEDTAIRFAFAAEILRIGCDPTGSFGF